MDINKGQTASFNIVAKRNGAIINLTGVAMTFVARKGSPSDGEVVISKSIGNGIAITNAAAGQAQLTIIGADTAALSDGFLFYKLQINAEYGLEDIDDGLFQVTVDTTPNLYVTVEEVRALGLDQATYPDPLVLATIKTWQQFIERACRQWFYPQELELELDGTDSDSIHFGVPVISISELRLNGDTAALNPSYYKIYSNLYTPTDRHNPRVKLVDQSYSHRDIYTSPDKQGRLWFRKGRKNQYVKGVFGYVEPDGGPPLLIKRALTKLVVEKLSKPVFVDPMNPPVMPPPLMAGVILEEWTDGHKIKYAQSGGELKARAPGLAGITDDPEVLGILRMYKAPIGVATPAHSSYR